MEIEMESQILNRYVIGFMPIIAIVVVTLMSRWM